MATTWQLYLYAANQESADRIAEQVFDEVDRIEDLLSNYREASELSRINRLAGQAKVVTDPETFRFLSEAQHWSAVSDGAFDMTVGKLMKIWGFYRKQGRVPDRSELESVAAVTGWGKVMLEAEDRSVRFSTQGVELDPGGIGKGFAVDSAMQLMRGAGVTRALLSAGSSTIAAIGAPPDNEGWRVVVPDPAKRGSGVSVVALRDMTLSTANCSEKNFTLDGRLYCHILDPKTLRPVEGVLQVTVLAPSATDSDALSNVLFVQSAARNLVLLRSLPNDRALVVYAGNAGRVCTAIRWRAPIARDFCEVKRVK